MNFLSLLSTGDIIAIAGIAVTIFGVAVAIYYSRRNLEVARLSYARQVAEPVDRAFALAVGDWPAATITITNTGDDHLPISRIGFDINGDGIGIKYPAVDHMSLDKFPCLLIRRAGLKINFHTWALDRIPINVKTRVVLELTTGTRLTCDGSIFTQVDEISSAG